MLDAELRLTESWSNDHERLVPLFIAKQVFARMFCDDDGQ